MYLKQTGKRFLMILLACMVYSIASTGYAGVKLEAVIPDFSMTDNLGKVTGSTDMEGKVAVLIFSHKDTTEETNKWHLAIENKYKGNKDFIIRSIAVLNVPFFVTDEMVNEKLQSSEVPMLKDWKGEVAGAFGASDEDPSILVINKNGKTAAYQEGPPDEALYKTIDGLLK